MIDCALIHKKGTGMGGIVKRIEEKITELKKMGMHQTLEIKDMISSLEWILEANKNQWISCSERMPEEHDTMFAKFKGTTKWSSLMFEKSSDNVNVTVELTDGKRITKTMHTIDGKWVYQSNVIKDVVAWKPLPEPYREETI